MDDDLDDTDQLDDAFDSAGAPRGHVPVLLDEVLALLAPEPGGVYVDATAGLGGHAAAIAPKLSPGGTVVLNDLDPGNLDAARARVEGALPPESGVRVVTIHGGFAELPRRLPELGLSADMVLADLGFSSNQVDDPARGLSFRSDGPLDMRLNPDAPLTAADLVNELPEAELADILWRYGEERASRRVAAKIVAARAQRPISTTGQLAEIVRAGVGFARRPAKGACRSGRGPSRGIDPATRSFQALRIAVNDELGSLGVFLTGVQRSAERAQARGGHETAQQDWLRPGARVAVIAFHSLEDRPVKQAFVAMGQSGVVERLTRKAVQAGEAEIGINPRARSARLRAVRLLG